MAKDEVDDLLPDIDAAKGFYAKYEPKEILGRYNVKLISMSWNVLQIVLTFIFIQGNKFNGS